MKELNIVNLQQNKYLQIDKILLTLHWMILQQVVNKKGTFKILIKLILHILVLKISNKHQEIKRVV